ncbi:MAG: cystathionine beta-lyase/cystathionine gamma-synthase, partial [Dokdonia sp.]
MEDNTMLKYITDVLTNMPIGWLNLTTHRLDIYEEKLAKTQFLDQFENLFHSNNAQSEALSQLPTAYDYIRLGHPLSSILEWVIAHSNNINSENVISFSSKTVPILSILRKNLLDNRDTQIVYTNELPPFFEPQILREIYGYTFELKKVESIEEITHFNGSTVFISQTDALCDIHLQASIDFSINLHSHLGSVLVVNGKQNENYISEIQHVRRRETIAMTPINSLNALQKITRTAVDNETTNVDTHKLLVLESIKQITGTGTTPLVGSSGLSIQYAIMMGLIHDALAEHPGKAIKIIVPTNCYGGTNDQARRVAACIDQVEVVDLAVDGENDMVQSIDVVLAKLANENAIPYIIAEIPTNPRVEVPDLIQLKDAL